MILISAKSPLLVEVKNTNFTCPDDFEPWDMVMIITTIIKISEWKRVFYRITLNTPSVIAKLIFPWWYACPAFSDSLLPIEWLYYSLRCSHRGENLLDVSHSCPTVSLSLLRSLQRPIFPLQPAWFPPLSQVWPIYLLQSFFPTRALIKGV